MINTGQIAEILSLYQKHGWTLRRVLLSDALKKSLAENLENLFGEIELFPSEIDAVWFSRPARNNLESWELRRLSENPFALYEAVRIDADQKTREEILQNAEANLKNLK
jgi:hypothetical protein